MTNLKTPLATFHPSSTPRPPQNVSAFTGFSYTKYKSNRINPSSYLCTEFGPLVRYKTHRLGDTLNAASVRMHRRAEPPNWRRYERVDMHGLSVGSLGENTSSDSSFQGHSDYNITMLAQTNFRPLNMAGCFQLRGRASTCGSKVI